MPLSQSKSFIQLASQMAFHIWQLFSGVSKFFFHKERRKTITGSVGWLLVSRVCVASKKQEHIIQTMERCVVIEKGF